MIDLVIFEERIRQNIDNMKRIKSTLQRKILVMLLILALGIYGAVKIVKFLALTPWTVDPWLRWTGWIGSQLVLVTYLIFLGRWIKHWYNTPIKR